MSFFTHGFNFEGVGRPAYGEAGMVLVPKYALQNCFSKRIMGGSGIVGFRTLDCSATICYYEGNLYSAENLNSFEERVMCAYGRMAKSYATVAMCGDQNDSFEVVGFVTPNGVALKDSLALDAWIALDPTLKKETIA